MYQVQRSTSNRSINISSPQCRSIRKVIREQIQSPNSALTRELGAFSLKDKSYEIAVNDPLPSAISVWDTAHCQHHCTNFIPRQLCLSSRFVGTLTLDKSLPLSLSLSLSLSPSPSLRRKITSWQACEAPSSPRVPLCRPRCAFATCLKHTAEHDRRGGQRFPPCRRPHRPQSM